MTVPGVQSALSVKNAGVEMLAESDKTQAVSGSDQFWRRDAAVYDKAVCG